eukprot:scaffold9425_cov61-Phaeocystis_antarctica.AAC.2
MGTRMPAARAQATILVPPAPETWTKSTVRPVGSQSSRTVELIALLRWPCLGPLATSLDAGTAGLNTGTATEPAVAHEGLPPGNEGSFETSTWSIPRNVVILVHRSSEQPVKMSSSSKVCGDRTAQATNVLYIAKAVAIWWSCPSVGVSAPPLIRTDDTV